MTKKLSTLMKKIGMSDKSLNCHQIRYSFGRKFFKQSGGNLSLTSQMMRHRSMAITEGYLRRSNTELNQLLKKRIHQE